jgi:hypothetical protein
MKLISKIIRRIFVAFALLGLFVFACIWLAGAAIHGSIKLFESSISGRYFINRKK